tara:strand:- start:691 stop:1392 length:702 start_codon:yes stop_codon:yes gene_type:complete
MKLSIIVPCFNESKNIPLILEKFSFVINRNDIEVFLVDNGSTDDTQAVLDHLVPKYNFVRVISIRKNNGYGNGITSGLSAAKGEFLGYTHADMQTDPADLIRALEIIENHPNPHNCFVKGSRKGRPCFDQFFTSGMSFFESIYMKQKLRDINAQPNIFHRDFYEVIKAKCPTDFSLDLYFLYMARKKELEIVRFDVIFPERIHGESSWNKGLISIWKLIIRTFVYSFKLKRDL